MKGMVTRESRLVSAADLQRLLDEVKRSAAGSSASEVPRRHVGRGVLPHERSTELTPTAPDAERLRLREPLRGVRSSKTRGATGAWTQTEWRRASRPATASSVDLVTSGRQRPGHVPGSGSSVLGDSP